MSQIEILNRAKGGVFYFGEARILGTVVGRTRGDVTFDVLIEGEHVLETRRLSELTLVSVWRE